MERFQVLLQADNMNRNPMQQKRLHLEEQLGFDLVRKALISYCRGELGRNNVSKIRFSNSLEKVTLYLEQTEEYKKMLKEEDQLPSLNYTSIQDEFIPIRIPGTRIPKELLPLLKEAILCASSFLVFFKKNTSYPLLADIGASVYIEEGIVKRLTSLIDEKGEIADHASPALFEIRQDQKRKLRSIDKTLLKVFTFAKASGWTPEHAEISLRNGRLVIPLIDTHRRKLKGFVQDESATRQTAYIEPAEVVELNNDLKELEFAERREVDRILLEFTDFLRPFLDPLRQMYTYLGHLDLIQAKAYYALHIQAVLPSVQKEPFLDWKEARHPLLWEKLKNQPQTLIPLDIRLDKAKRILLISGPNAGGKSVCLKTVGLVQYMLQSGLLVPLKESSECGLFDSIFIEIGDQQSIENALSTYSSHLYNMKALIEEANPHLLFLIDEFGSGTEPRIGGAIAEAILKKLYAKGAFGVVSTHYANLKLMADSFPAIQNAAMLYDSKRMCPLYRLQIGKPGSSFAFEIACKIGLPQDVLEEVKSASGKGILDFEKQLQQLEVEKLEVQKKQRELAVADDFLSEMIEKYTLLNEQLQAKKREILHEAKIEAIELLKETNRRIENTISDIKLAQAEKVSTKQAREKIRIYQAEMESQVLTPIPSKIVQKVKVRQSKSPLPEAHTEPLKPGDIVQIDEQNAFAEVVSVKKNKVELISNSVRLSIDKDKVKKSTRQAIEHTSKSQKRNYASIYDSINERRAAFSPSIDLRGKRAEEALDLLQKCIDEASLLGEKNIRILHGKGNGILKTVIRRYLKEQAEVKSFCAEHVEYGGEGITLVSLA